MEDQMSGTCRTQGEDEERIQTVILPVLLYGCET